MKWFKHHASRHLDRRLDALWEEYGPELYGFYWRIVESVADEANATSHKARKGLLNWSKGLHIDCDTFLAFLARIEGIGLIGVIQQGSDVEICVPDLEKNRDEWSRKSKLSTKERVIHKNSGVAPESLRSCSGETVDKSKNCGQVEMHGFVPESFAAFWDSYPKKWGYGAAEEQWLAINPSGDMIEQIMDALEAHKRSDQWTKDSGQFVPSAAKWLKEKRWMDQLEGSEQEAYNPWALSNYQ